MKTGIPGIWVLGCLLCLLMAGCAANQTSKPDNSEIAGTSHVVASQNSDLHFRHVLTAAPFDSTNNQGISDSGSSRIKAYDQLLVSTIKEEWEQEIDGIKINAHEKGVVIITFWLHFDGSVGNVHIAETHVGPDLTSICETAVRESAPFPRWPHSMLQEVGSGSFQITMTFEYH